MNRKRRKSCQLEKERAEKRGDREKNKEKTDRERDRKNDKWRDRVHIKKRQRGATSFREKGRVKEIFTAPTHNSIYAQLIFFGVLCR